MHTSFLRTARWAVLLLPLAAWAQQPVVPRTATPESPYKRYTTYQATVRYGVALPLGSLGEYTGGMGTRNFALSGEWVLPAGNLSFGAQFNSHYFQKRMPRQLYTSQTGADVSAVQTRVFQAQSLLATGKYHFADVTAVVRPYVQAGAGVALVEYGNYLGSLENDADNGFRFAGQVAAGSRVLLGREGHFAADLQVSYQHIGYRHAQVSRPGVVGVWAGISYRWW